MHVDVYLCYMLQWDQPGINKRGKAYSLANIAIIRGSFIGVCEPLDRIHIRHVTQVRMELEAVVKGSTPYLKSIAPTHNVALFMNKSSFAGGSETDGDKFMERWNWVRYQWARCGSCLNGPRLQDLEGHTSRKRAHEQAGSDKVIR